MRSLTIIFLYCATQAYAQSSISHFSIWRPKEGQEQNFENGYKVHLKWHKDNGDKWNWYGWYVVSGVRTGYFVDASVNHMWSDFDNPVNPANDYQDNSLHTIPFGDFMTSYKTVKLADLSFSDAVGLKSRILRCLFIKINDIENGKKMLQNLKNRCQADGVKVFMSTKMTDGDDLLQLIVLIGFNKLEELSRIEAIAENILAIEHELGLKTVLSINSETWLYQESMSYFSD